MTTSNVDLPDIEQLTKLANEMFTALPCDGSRINAALHGAVPNGFGLPGEAELRHAFAPRQPSFHGVANSLDTGAVLPKPSPLAGLDQSVLAGVLPQDFGLPDATQLQQLLGSRVPHGSTVPGSAASAKPSAPIAASPQVIEATPATVGMAAAMADFDASLIAGLSPQAYGLPGEAELRQLFGAFDTPTGHVPASAASGPSYYFIDERKTGAFHAAHPAFDVQAIRRDFPILNERVNGRQLVWFDNAATTQKPQQVIDRISYFYQHENSNIHRAAHDLAARATDAYENARNTVARFLNASSASEIVFARGTTEAINLVAQSWGRQNIKAGDEIVITWLEHHANIVPWKQLCDGTGATLRVAPVDDDGQVLLSEYQKLLSSKTKLVAFTQVSNALGTVTPAKEMIDIAHRVGARVLLDGAQSVSHLRADVQALDCDWFVFSGHKIFAPTGIGVLYGKADLLEATAPWQGGGNMIEDVTFEKIVYQPAPAKFEAGTGNIADAVGLGAALEYVMKLGIDNIARYEHELLEYAMAGLKSISGLRLIGTAKAKTSVLSFVLEGHSNQDIGVALNRAGIAVRTGHHCAQPILRRFGLESSVRPSLAFYNTYEEVDHLIKTVRRIQSGRDF